MVLFTECSIYSGEASLTAFGVRPRRPAADGFKRWVQNFFSLFLFAVVFWKTGLPLKLMISVHSDDF